MRTVVQLREAFPVIGFNGFVLLFLATVLVACTSVNRWSLLDGRTVVESAETVRHADLVYHLLAGEFAVRSANFPVALTHYLNAVRHTDDPEVLKSAVRLALHNNDYANAIRLSRQWLEYDPGNLELQQLLAVTYVMDRRFEEAMQALEQLIGQEGIDQSRIFTIFSATLLSKLPVEAKQRMKEMAERFSGNARAQYVYAVFLLDTGDYDEVARLAAEAAALEPGFANAYLLEGWALILSGQVEAGLAAASAAVAVAPEDVDVRANYARLLLDNGRLQEALAEFHVVHRHRPHHPDVVQALGILSLQQERFDEALGFFDQLETFPGRGVEAAYYKARIAEERGEPQRALVMYRAIPAGAFFKKAQISIAEVYRKLGDIGKAAEQLEMARELTSETDEKIEFYLVQGDVLSHAKRYQEAIEIYTQAIQEYGELNSLLYARGLAAAELGLIAQVEADLGKILRQDPENVDALNSLGYVLADHNVRLDEAQTYIRRAYALQPDNPAILDSMGWVEFRLHNIDVAEQFIRRAIAGLNHPEVIGHLVEILCVRQQVGEANLLLEEGLQGFPQDDYLQSLRGHCSH